MIDPKIATCPPFPTPVITSQYLPDPVLFGAVDDIEEYIEGDDKLIVIPGEDYSQHDSVRIVSLPNGSSEPCCGTHLSHLSDIQARVTYHTLILLGFCKVKIFQYGFNCLEGPFRRDQVSVRGKYRSL